MCVVCLQFFVFSNEPVLHQQGVAGHLRTAGPCGAICKSDKEEKLNNNSRCFLCECFLPTYMHS